MFLLLNKLGGLQGRCKLYSAAGSDETRVADRHDTSWYYIGLSSIKVCAVEYAEFRASLDVAVFPTGYNVL